MFFILAVTISGVLTAYLQPLEPCHPDPKYTYVFNRR